MRCNRHITKPHTQTKTLAHAYWIIAWNREREMETGGALISITTSVLVYTNVAFCSEIKIITAATHRCSVHPQQIAPTAFQHTSVHKNTGIRLNWIIFIISALTISKLTTHRTHSKNDLTHKRKTHDPKPFNELARAHHTNTHTTQLTHEWNIHKTKIANVSPPPKTSAQTRVRR